MSALRTVGRWAVDITEWLIIAVGLTCIALFVTDTYDSIWSRIAMALFLVTVVAPMIYHGIRNGIRNRRYYRGLSNLDELDAEHQDPDSGLWRVMPPCGYEHWNLYAPGTKSDDLGFVRSDPYAQFPVPEEGPGTDDGPHFVPELEEWMTPWIEQVSGGRVVSLVTGWSAPYGEGGWMREWTVFARVEPREARTEQAAAIVRRPGPVVSLAKREAQSSS
jgi:hypothetical protein